MIKRDAGMNPDELILLRQIADDTATARTLLETHTTQIALIFAEQRAHADKITVIQTKQDLCQKQNDPGNASERNGVRIAIIGAIISILWQIVELIK